MATTPRTGDVRERRAATSCRVLMAAALETPFRPRAESGNGKGRGCGSLTFRACWVVILAEGKRWLPDAGRVW